MNNIKEKIYYFLIKNLSKYNFFKNTSFSRFFKSYWEVSVKNEMHIYSIIHKKELKRKDAIRKVIELYKNKISIPHMDLSVGTSCTLNCEKCSQWFPYLHKHELFSANKIINDLNNIFKFVDFIHNIAVIGGEPFLNPDLEIILQYLKECCENGQIRYIRLVTNGTICPSEKVLKYFKDSHFCLIISNYPFEKMNNANFIENRNKLINILENNKEYHYYFPAIQNWEDYGKPIKDMERDKNYLKKDFDNCLFHNCCGLYDSIFYRCPRIFTLKKIKKLEPGMNEYIDFKNVKSKKECKKRLKAFYSIDYLKACNWCLDSSRRKMIEPAIQLIKENNK